VAKERTHIPPNTAAEIQFASDRTCCVCRLRGKPIQIHHLDEDPTNHERNNLAVLCFDCHRDTQITGGFDRKLDASQLVLYRDDWHRRVAARRNAVAGVEAPLPPVAIPPAEPGGGRSLDARRQGTDAINDTRMLGLIRALPIRRLTVYRQAQPKWDTGVTVEMVEGNGMVVEALKGMLIELAAFYPKSHFDGRRHDDYFQSAIQDLARWHRECLEPNGPGSGGTIVGVLTGGELISSLEKMVADMVQALTHFRDDFNFHAWRAEWQDDRVSSRRN
jgi:hypothetical protein